MSMEIKIGKKIISNKSPVFIIAEAGVNHNGQLDLALKLVDAAARAGADAVKFQTFKAEQVVTMTGKIANYQKKNIGSSESQLSMLKKLEFSEKWYPKVIKRCRERNIIFLSTPQGGFASVDLIKDKVQTFKFGSSDLTNLPLLQYAAKFKKPMLVSTGMGNLAEISEAVAVIKKAGNNKIVVLHCTTDYPCRHEDVNLKAMETMMEDSRVLVGYSDHTSDFQPAIMATTLGACIIEKHLTLDRSLLGPDHKASLEPKEFKSLVEQLRKVKVILGSSEKVPVKRELQYFPLIRKSIVSVSDIKKGEKLTSVNLAIMRPGTGIAPRHYTRLLGKKAVRDIKASQLIKENDYEK